MGESTDLKPEMLSIRTLVCFLGLVALCASRNLDIFHKDCPAVTVPSATCDAKDQCLDCEFSNQICCSNGCGGSTCTDRPTPKYHEECPAKTVPSATCDAKDQCLDCE